MTARGRRILEEAMTLPAEERADLAERLFVTLDEEAAARIAWGEEIARRIDELDSGKVKPVPHDEAMRKIFGRADDSAAD